MNRSLVNSLRFSTPRSNLLWGCQRFQSIRRLATSPPPRRRPHASSSSSGNQSFKERINGIKKSWEQLNEHPKFRTVASACLILLYSATAYAGVQYLSDTKYKATGEPNPYKKREDAEKERFSKTSIEDLGNSESASSSSSSSSSACQHNKFIVPAQDTTEVYDKMAHEYDDKIWLDELVSHIWYRRRQLMKHVHGDTLEVSCGTGRNVSYFDPEKTTSVTFMDSSRSMLEVAREKFTQKFPTYDHVQYVKGKAEDLASMAASSGQKFDTIYETFGLCSHEDPVAALQNFGSLLRKGGRIVLLEHGKSHYKTLNDTIDKKAENHFKEWGCRWNLDIDQIVKDSGLDIVESDRYHFGTSYFYILKRHGDE